MLADVVGADFGVARVRRTEQIIKAAHQRFVREQHVMLENTAHFMRKLILWDTVMVIKTGLRAPADVQGGMNVRFRPFHDFNQLVPVLDLLERHQLDRCAGDDKTVVFLVANVVKGLVERQEVILRRVFGMIGLGLDEVDLDLNGRVGQTAQNLRLGHDLERHQIENGDAERTNALGRRAVFGHNEDVFALENRTRRQAVGNFYRQEKHLFRMIMVSISNAAVWCAAFCTYYNRGNRKRQVLRNMKKTENLC